MMYEEENNENDPSHRGNALVGRNAALGLEHHLDQATHAQRAEYWRERYFKQKARMSSLENRYVALTEEMESLRNDKAELKEKCKELIRRDYGLAIVHGFDLSDLHKKLERSSGRTRSLSHRGTQTRESYSSPGRVSRSRGRRVASRKPTPGPSSRREVTPPRVKREEPEPRNDEPLPRFRTSVRNGFRKRGRHGRMEHRSKLCRCGLLFPTKVALNRHLYEKCRGKLFCDDPNCREWFSQVEDVNRHKKRMHPGQKKNWACSGCNGFFADKWEVKAHKNRDKCQATRICVGIAYPSVRNPEDVDYMRQGEQVDFNQFPDY